MASIYLFKRIRKKPDGSDRQDKYYTADIQLGRKTKFQRGTGCAVKRQAMSKARQFVVEAESQLTARQNPDISIDQLFGGYVQEHVSTLRSRETALIRLEHLLKHLDASSILQITPPVLTRYIQKRRKQGVSPATINRELTQLRAALSHANKGWGTKIPQIDWKHFTQTEAKERIVLEKLEDVQRIFSFLPEHIRLCALFCYYTSCRLNAMLTLTWPKVNLPACQAIMLNKGGAEIPFALPDQAVAVLEQAAFLDDQLPGQKVFNSTNRRKHWEEARQKAEMAHFNWHDIRHFTATTLSAQGENTRMIQKILKHSDISTTQRYTHVATEDVRAALNKLPALE